MYVNDRRNVGNENCIILGGTILGLAAGSRNSKLGSIKTYYILETRSVPRKSDSGFDSSLRIVATYQKTEGTALGKRVRNSYASLACCG